MPKKKTFKLLKIKNKDSASFAFKVTMNVVSVSQNDTVQQVAKALEKHKIGAVVVTKEEHLIGIISERDVTYKVVAKGKDPTKILAKDIMTRKVVSINLEDGLNAIHEKMKNIPFRHLPVRKGNEIIGMVSSRDLMFLKRLKSVTPKK